MILLINKERLMKKWKNNRIYNAMGWTSVVLLIGLTLALVVLTVKDLTAG